MGLGNIFSVTAEPAALPAAELLLPVPETDKLLSAAVAGQAVWFAAAVFVPPCTAACRAAERLLFFARGLDERAAAVFTYIRIRFIWNHGLYAAAAADGFYGIGRERQQFCNFCK